jgi:hypothetical protein
VLSSECKKTADMAEAFGIRYDRHRDALARFAMR